MEKEYNISVFTENSIGMLNRMSIIFTRRHLNIESITASESEVKGVHRYTIVSKMTEDKVKKVAQQIEKQVEVLKVFYHDDSKVVYQEIALYKIPTHVLANGMDAEKIIRAYNARILTVEADFAIIEKTGHSSELQALFNDLEPYGILEFVKSGRVAITKPMKTLESYLYDLAKN